MIRAVEAISGHLERLGGMLMAPRSTIARMLERDEGRLWSVLSWLAVLGVTLGPEPVGRAVLVGRVDVLGGLFMLVNGLTQRFAVPLAGVIGAAAVLGFAAHRAGARLPVDRALDLAAFLLVPFLMLASVGALLSSVGVEAWFLPHRPLRGAAGVVAMRSLVGFGASLVLLVVAVRTLSAPEDP